MLDVDLIIEARWVLPIQPAEAILREHALIVDAGRIVALAPIQAVRRTYRARTCIVRDRHALLPGLVNAHAHAAMTLLPATPPRSPVSQWLRELVWPLEKRWVSAEFVRAGTQLAWLEMLSHGITCMADMYLFPEEAARVAGEWRLRAAVGLPIADGPSNWARSADEYLERSGALYDQWRGDAWVTPYFAPHAPYSVSNDTLTRLRRAADQLDAPIAMHLHETTEEVQGSLREHGVRPIERLHRLGLLRAGFAAIHAVELSDSDISLLAQQGCGVVHCPGSNLRLGAGIAPLVGLAAAGVRLALGTDGALSGLDPDLLAEARLAALLASGQTKRANAWPAHDALRAATLGGAETLGLADRIGSLTPGKDADVIAIEVDPATAPTGDQFADHLLLSGPITAEVSDVWTQGRARRLAYHWQDLDADSVRAAASAWRARMNPEHQA
jgi:5-methylthioadenosine/S-adenosylhomocysteine deaminase